MVGVAADKGIRRGAVLRIDDEDASTRRHAVVGDKRAGSRDIDVVFLSIVEMDAMVAIMLGPRGHRLFAIGGVNHEQHCGASYWGRRVSASLAQPAATFDRKGWRLGG